MKKHCTVCGREFLDTSPNHSRKTCSVDCKRIHSGKLHLARERVWRARRRAWRDRREEHKVKM